MHKITAQLKILFFSAAFLLPAISALASLQTPTLPDLQELQEECFAAPAHIPDTCPDQLTWQQLEAENAVRAVLMIPDNPFEEPYIALVPCDPKNRQYRFFRDRQPPLGLETTCAMCEDWEGMPTMSGSCPRCKSVFEKGVLKEANLLTIGDYIRNWWAKKKGEKSHLSPEKQDLVQKKAVNTATAVLIVTPTPFGKAKLVKDSFWIRNALLGAKFALGRETAEVALTNKTVADVKPLDVAKDWAVVSGFGIATEGTFIILHQGGKSVLAWHRAMNAKFSYGAPPGGHWSQGVGHQYRLQQGLVGTDAQVHHWAIPQNQWGRNVPNYLKNRPWNFKIVSSRAAHARIDTAFSVKEVTPYVAPVRVFVAMPNWARVATVGTGIGTAYIIVELTEGDSDE